MWCPIAPRPMKLTEVGAALRGANVSGVELMSKSFISKIRIALHYIRTLKLLKNHPYIARIAYLISPYFN
jgi:hypothetical protein